MQKTEFRSVNIIDMLNINLWKSVTEQWKKELFGSHHHLTKWYESFPTHISFKSRLDIDAMGKTVL